MTDPLKALTGKPTTAMGAIIAIAMGLVGLLAYEVRGDVRDALQTARATHAAMENHVQQASEASSLQHMLLVQICVNTAQSELARQNCLNYR